MKFGLLLQISIGLQAEGEWKQVLTYRSLLVSLYLE